MAGPPCAPYPSSFGAEGIAGGQLSQRPSSAEASQALWSCSTSRRARQTAVLHLKPAQRGWPEVSARQCIGVYHHAAVLENRSDQPATKGTGHHYGRGYQDLTTTKADLEDLVPLSYTLLLLDVGQGVPEQAILI